MNQLSNKKRFRREVEKDQIREIRKKKNSFKIFQYIIGNSSIIV